MIHDNLSHRPPLAYKLTSISKVTQNRGSLCDLFLHLHRPGTFRPWDGSWPWDGSLWPWRDFKPLRQAIRRFNLSNPYRLTAIGQTTGDYTGVLATNTNSSLLDQSSLPLPIKWTHLTFLLGLRPFCGPTMEVERVKQVTV